MTDYHVVGVCLTIAQKNDGCNIERNIPMGGPSMIDTDLLKSRTYSTTWDAQCLGAYRDGGVWTYDSFTDDAPGEGQGVGLFISAVENRARVWLNGPYSGMSSCYVKAFVFDLTAHLKPGVRNVLVLPGSAHQ